jgi:putative membrane protein
MDVSVLPAVNATLNGIATLLLLTGYVFVKRRDLERHKIVMIGAGVTSALFLISYVVYHYHAGSVRFLGQGAVRPVYFTLLISHVILAASIAVLVPMTFWRAFKDPERHKRIARITFPIWLYVSITGVLIYAMLYHLYKAEASVTGPHRQAGVQFRHDEHEVDSLRAAADDVDRGAAHCPRVT